MLKIAGIEGMPALVPVYREYFDENMPSLAALIMLLRSFPMAINISGWMQPMKLLLIDSPPFILPTKVFLINADGSYRFVETPTPDPTKKIIPITDITFRIDEEGNADCRFSIRHISEKQRKLSVMYINICRRNKEKNLLKNEALKFRN